MRPVACKACVRAANAGWQTAIIVFLPLARELPGLLQTRYGLLVRVSEPFRTDGKVSTWKITIETRPGARHLPAQRIHLDICAIPSHDPRPMMLRNLYGIDLGTSGLILQAQSREEILADKTSRTKPDTQPLPCAEPSTGRDGFAFGHAVCAARRE